MLDERFQREATSWFDEHYGLKPTLVRLDNTIGYRLLDETRHERDTHVSSGQMLLNDELVTALNQPPVAFERIQSSVELVRRAQVALMARGKVLIVVVLPSKLSVYADLLDDRWRDPLYPTGETRPWRATVVEPYMRELRRVGARFVDGEAILAPLAREHREVLYTLEGRHLNAPAECILFEAALAMARPLLPERTIPSLDCTYSMTDVTSVAYEEYDFFRLVNTWGEPATRRIALLPTVVPETVPESQRPDTLIMGSSFAGRWLLEAVRNHATRRTDFFYYNRTLIDPTLHESPIPDPTTAAWRELALTRDLYLVPLPQEFLPGQPDVFLQQVIDGLAASR